MESLISDDLNNAACEGKDIQEKSPMISPIPTPPQPTIPCENISTPPLPEYKIISLGYRCSVAGILKKLGLKHESFPFDWLVSRLPVIKDCIKDDFEEFLRLDNYQMKYAQTFAHMNTFSGFVCNEHMLANMYYQPSQNRDPINAYQLRLAMNHHNIVENTKDYEYYHRCVDRFRRELDSPTSKMFVHISPLFTIDDYHEYGDTIIQECHDFQSFLEKRIKTGRVGSSSSSSGSISPMNEEPIIRCLYFIMLLDSLETTPNISILHEGTEEENQSEKYKIYLLRTNHDFVDAGETFMGNYRKEEELIEMCIRRFSI